jgi:hypothetical protein
MRIYIASRDQAAGRNLRDLLLSAGHTVASRWLDIEGYGSLSDDEASKRSASVSDIQDVRESDLLVLRSEPDGAFVPGGKHVETGVALALEKPVIVLGRPENIFHWHPLVSVVYDERELLGKLGQMSIVAISTSAATPGESTMDDLTKMQFDYAWKWFDFHAKQRTTLFNYFMVIVGILANALVTALKEGYQTLIIPIGILGATTSLAFIVFDIRNRHLVRQAEDVLEKLEDDHIYPAEFQGGARKRLGFMVVERASTMREGQARGFWKSFLKHKWWIRGLEFAVGVCFVASLFLPAHSAQRNQVADLQEQLRRVETSLQNTSTRPDVQSLRDNLARVELSARDTVHTAELRALSDQLADQRASILKINKSLEAIEHQLSLATQAPKPTSGEK